MPFAIQNKASTANKKSHKSVQFILTQRGILTIQGADDSLINTLHVKKIFHIIYSKYIAPFVYNQ